MLVTHTRSKASTTLRTPSPSAFTFWLSSCNLHAMAVSAPKITT
jgi:hypothetical protein